jgi:hypothetical protein
MNRIFAITFLFLIFGCNTGNDIPKGILPPVKMQHIMWDMLQADGFASYSLDTMMRKPAKRMELYSTVLTTHKISQEAFRKNIQFYESRPDLLKVVLDSLQQMALRDTATIVIKEQKVRPDTVKSDTSKFRPDTVKIRKLSIEKMKSIKALKSKPV